MRGVGERGRAGGQEGEIVQVMYAHMNNERANTAKEATENIQTHGD
jgi:hypothetical protein